MTAGLRLPRDFYTRDAVTVARALLGARLTVAGRGHTRRSGLIVETEAYCGPEDRACHAFGGRRTARTEPMFAIGGTAYVYLVYGLHHQFNVVTSGVGDPQAVLVRAVAPVEGLAGMRRRRAGRADRELSNGPGKLCCALGIDRRLDGADLLGDRVWIEAPDCPIAPSRIARGTRVGIEYAQAWAQRPWRFWISGNPYVSRPTPGSRSSSGLNAAEGAGRPGRLARAVTTAIS